MRYIIKNIFLGMLTLGFVTDLCAEIHRWVDENGQVHYEERTKAQSASGLQSYKPPTGAGQSPQERMEKTRKLLNAYQVERQQTREREEEKRKEREKRKHNCALARDNLRQNQSYGSIYRLNKQGEREYLSEPERRESLQRSRDDVAEWCGE
jgi:hypothetical protein